MDASTYDIGHIGRPALLSALNRAGESARLFGR